MTDAARHASPDRPLTAALPSLLALALAGLLSFGMQGSFAIVQEAAKAELKLTDYQLSLVSGVSAAVPLLLLSIPIGLAVDRYNRVRILLVLALAWTVGTAWTAVAGGVASLFTARMLTALGMAGALTAALSIAADLCAPAQRGAANLIVNLGKVAGQAAGIASTGAFMAAFAVGGRLGFSDWRATHLALAAIGAVLLLPLLLLREPPRQEIEAGPRATLAVQGRELWSRRRVLLPLFLGQMSIVMADGAGGIWAAPVLMRRFHLAPGDFAGWLGLIFLGAGLIGSIVGGVSADWGSRSGRRGGLLLGATAAALLGVPAALFPIAPSALSLALAIGVLATCGAVTGLVMGVALTVLLPNELRGLTIGAFIALAGLFGFGVAPPLVAAASGALGGEAHLPAALALVGGITSLIGFAGFAVATRRLAV